MSCAAPAAGAAIAALGADVNVAAERAPTPSSSRRSSENQALLYRLSGDMEPAPRDPSSRRPSASRAHPARPLHLRLRRAPRHQGLREQRPALLQEHQGALLRQRVPRRDADHRDVEGRRQGPLPLQGEGARQGVHLERGVELYKEIPKPKAKPAAARRPGERRPGRGAQRRGDERGGLRGARTTWRRTRSSPNARSTVFQFKLTNPDSAWVIDLKQRQGRRRAPSGKADCTLELADADFLGMASGKADPQKLYFGGKLKIGQRDGVAEARRSCRRSTRSRRCRPIREGAARKPRPAPAAAGGPGARRARAPDERRHLRGHRRLRREEPRPRARRSRRLPVQAHRAPTARGRTRSQERQGLTAGAIARPTARSSSPTRTSWR
jgi:hypothetical protein